MVSFALVRFALGWPQAGPVASDEWFCFSPHGLLPQGGLCQGLRQGFCGERRDSAALFFDNLAAVRVASNPMRNASF